MKAKKSAVYKFRGKFFRYDYEDCVVEWLAKATEEEYKDNEEWMKKYGKKLFHIDEKGFYEIESIGLRPENWKNKAVRDEYLAEFCDELQSMAEQYVL